MTETRVSIPGKIVSVAAKPDRYFPAPVDSSGVKQGWAVDFEYIDEKGRRMPDKARFSSKTEALNFIAWERSKLFPEGNEAMLKLTKEEFGEAVGWNVNRSWSFEVRHLLEDKKFKDARELCQEFLRLYDLAGSEAKSLLKVALHWSLERLPNFKEFPNDSPIKTLYYDATNNFDAMLPVIKRMAILPPARNARHGSQIDVIEIDTDAELQGLGIAEVVSAGGENIYMKQDGFHYFAKIYATEKFGPGMHDFSEESFEKVKGNKVHSEFSDNLQFEFFIVKAPGEERFDVKWLDEINHEIGVVEAGQYPTLDAAMSCVRDLADEANATFAEKKKLKVGM